MSIEFQDGRQKVDYTLARKTICLDYNGVLDTYRGWIKGYTYPPRDGAREFLRKLFMEGYNIVIFTAMNPDDVNAWLIDNSMSQYVMNVTNVKVPAIVYLDDRGITFDGDFDKAFDAILNFKTFWEDADHIEGGKVG